MTKEIDARGLACPAPVLNTKQTLDKETVNSIKVIVDNEAAQQNVTRFLQSQKFEITSEQIGNDFHIMGKRGEDISGDDCKIMDFPESENKKILVMVTTDRIGHGDDTLGAKLMVAFLKTLKEMGKELWRLVFLNSGVKLTVEGSDMLPPIKELEASGVSILVCGTCLDHFKLLEKKQVGETTNMLDIITSLQVTDKVINI